VNPAFNNDIFFDGQAIPVDSNMENGGHGNTGSTLVDGSYIGSQIVVESRKKHGIELVGPAKQNWHHAQVESGYDLSAFKIDWDGHFAIVLKARRVPVGGRLQAILVGHHFARGPFGWAAPFAIPRVAQTHLQNLAVACAINLQRLTDYWVGEPPAVTRASAFTRVGLRVM
jgi:hypothetical protein